MKESFARLTQYFLDYFLVKVDVIEPFKPNGKIAKAYGVFEYNGWQFEVELGHDGYVYYLVTGDGDVESLDVIDLTMDSVRRDHAKLMRIAEDESEEVRAYV